jgi:hypothetical protein
MKARLKMWSTTIHALDPIDGIYKEFGGPFIKAPSKALAHEYCQHHGLGYCCVGNEVVMNNLCKREAVDIFRWGEVTDIDINMN